MDGLQLFKMSLFQNPRARVEVRFVRVGLLWQAGMGGGEQEAGQGRAHNKNVFFPFSATLSSFGGRGKWVKW